MKCFEQVSKTLLFLVPSTKTVDYYIYEESDGLIKYSKNEINEFEDSGKKFNYISLLDLKLKGKTLNKLLGREKLL